MSIVRPCDPTLAGLLPDKSVQLARCDLITFVLQDGVTTYRFTSWPRDLLIGGNTFVSGSDQDGNPWMTRSSWSLTNTMTVPKLVIDVLNTNTSFAGGASFKSQLRDGLFDGATVLLQYQFFTLPVATPPDTSMAPIDVFAGVTGQIDVGGVKTTITCKGKNNLLDQYVPRNVYQLACNHAFCDPGCTLLRASFTFSNTVGVSPAPTRTFIPWGSVPGTPGRFQSGSFHSTSGPAAGNWRTIIFADATGITLAYPTTYLVQPGDTFTVFQGCDKTKATCDGTYANLQHYRGFPFMPPPDTTF